MGWLSALIGGSSAGVSSGLMQLLRDHFTRAAALKEGDVDTLRAMASVADQPGRAAVSKELEALGRPPLPFSQRLVGLMGPGDERGRPLAETKRITEPFILAPPPKSTDVWLASELAKSGIAPADYIQMQKDPTALLKLLLQSEGLQLRREDLTERRRQRDVQMQDQALYRQNLIDIQLGNLRDRTERTADAKERSIRLEGYRRLTDVYKLQGTKEYEEAVANYNRFVQENKKYLPEAEYRVIEPGFPWKVFGYEPKTPGITKDKKSSTPRAPSSEDADKAAIQALIDAGAPNEVIEDYKKKLGVK